MKLQGLLIFLIGITAAGVMGYFLHTNRGEESGDPNQFSQVTGDVTKSTQEHWDRIFRKREERDLRPPTPFLVEHLKELPKGRALVLAMGVGRNAIFLAEQGYRVDGIDISSEALMRARREAQKSNVKINTIKADLREYVFPENAYDVIVCVSYFNPALIPKVKKALVKGGVALFVNYTENHYDADEPIKASREFFVKKGYLKKVFSDFEIVTYEETLEKTGAFAKLIAVKS